MRPYLCFANDPADSYSFLVGDSIREAIQKPWRFFYLPVTLYYRYRTYSRKKAITLTSNTDILYVIDSESLTKDEMKFVTKLLDSKANDIVASIGDLDKIGDYLLPSRKNNTDTKSQWNKDLENCIHGIISSHRPKKMIFFGKYPYAGFLSILRRLESNQSVAWVPIRSKPETIRGRSERFGHIIHWKFEQAPKKEFNLDGIYIDNKLAKDIEKLLSELIRSNKLTRSNPHKAGLHIYSESSIGRVQSALERGHIVIYLYQSVTNPVFANQKYATTYLPVQYTKAEECSYAINQIIELYSSKKVTPRTSDQELIEEWIEIIKQTFTQIKLDSPVD